MFYTYQGDILFWNGDNTSLLCDKIEKDLRLQYSYSGPYFLYNENILKARLQMFVDNFPGSQLYYSVKSLSNIHILKLIEGYKSFGLDVVSGGEIQRGLASGFKGSRMVYAGVGKTEEEIKLGLRENLKSFHVESVSEIRQIERIAKREGLRAPITLRLNPDIPVDTHKYIKTGVEGAKFGLNAGELVESVSIIKESENISLVGLQVHLGSQLLDKEVYFKGLDFLTNVAHNLESSLSTKIEYLSLGGGFGIDYNSTFTGDINVEFPLSDFAAGLAGKKNQRWRIDFEPGRFISAHSGLLVAHVLYIKPRNDFTIAITDAGMSELIRPALYGATHKILSIVKSSDEMVDYDVVGPICESGDFFARKMNLNKLREGDKIAIAHAGAYGSVMSSNYNSRPYVPEFLVTGESIRLIRRPQMPENIYSLELLA
ncbi:MAG: diaminopimelate decarboxylase [Spirochaetia bacterium]|nr:diaminopimelate decarboxylase [Spirochaetia bacterium]